jgi:Protein of unknown function (DUF1493)
MDSEVKQLRFSDLRKAYVIVRDFIQYESGMDVKFLDSRIDQDLGISGDDNYELLEKFVEKFQLDHDKFDYLKHFYSEGELFGSGAVLINMLTLPYWLFIKAMDFLTLHRFKLSQKLFKSNYERLDLSFRDMITWYIEGKYKLASDVKYQLKRV